MQKTTKSITTDSTYVQCITQVQYTADMNDITRPDGCWDIVFIKHQGQTEILLTGAITQPVVLPYKKDDEYLCISFKPNAFLSHLQKKSMLNVGTFLPKANSKYFYFGGKKWEIPSFENADLLAEKLVNQNLILSNNMVEEILQEQAVTYSDRSIQRHFRETTGITLNYFQQIQRAQKAMDLLLAGHQALHVAIELGYYDQPHMTKSLKNIMGILPSEISPNKK